MISTATIRSTNPKESKEKQNREKLLAGPGSEFSLANAEDFELDYYDYNVMNAGAAPGSYLGMDPAYLVWIPPIDEGDIMSEVDNNNHDEPHYEEILPRHHSIDPGSNTETPDDEILPELPPQNQRCINNKILATTLLNDSPLSPTSKLDFNDKTKRISNKLLENEISDGDEIPLHDFSYKTFNNRPSSGSSYATTNAASPPPITTSHNNKYISNKKSDDDEKETAVFKSPSDNKTEYSYNMDDIQFADDDDDDVDEDEDVHYDINQVVIRKNHEHDLKMNKKMTNTAVKGADNDMKT